MATQSHVILKLMRVDCESWTDTQTVNFLNICLNFYALVAQMQR